MEELLQFTPWIWGAIIVITLVIELFSSDIDALWFAFAAALSLILSLFDIHIAIQLSVFIIVATTLLFSLGRWAKKRLMTRHITENSDSLIGKEILVLESANEFDKGSGVIDDIVWTIVCQAGTAVEKGKHAIIIAIDENKLVVTRKPE